MKRGLDHLPEGKRRELEFVVGVIQEGFAKAIAHRTQPRFRVGKLLKIIDELGTQRYVSPIGSGIQAGDPSNVLERHVGDAGGKSRLTPPLIGPLATGLKFRSWLSANAA